MPKKILIIDDEELIIRSLAKMLEKKGYDVLLAKTGNDALVMAESEEFDLIISDIRMPGLDGVEVVRQILEMFRKKKVAKIPTIFITGYADQKIEERAKKLNPFAYIYKPFEYMCFLEKVREALEQ